MKRAFSLAILVSVFLLSYVAPTSSSEKALVIYSGRREALIQPIIELFQKETGVKVSVRYGGASELAVAVLEERGRPRADVIVANDAGTLEVLHLQKALTTNHSESVTKVPVDLRADDGSWVGISARARVIMYNTKLVQESELPRSVVNLTDPRWKGQVGITASNNESLIAHITGMRLVYGNDATARFLRELKRNGVVVYGGHTQVRQAVGKGEVRLGLVNHYYFHLEKAAGSPVGVIYPDQGSDDVGALVNVAGVGIINGARNMDDAKMFVDFLVSPDVQELFAKLNYEIPVIPGVPVHEARPLNGFKRMKVQLEALGRELDATLDLIEKVGF